MNNQPQFSLSQFKKDLDANRAKITAVKSDLANLQSSQHTFQKFVFAICAAAGLIVAAMCVFG